MQNFTLRQLEYFVACVDCGSVAAAADVLNVSQPTISVALSKLEAQFGVQLLLRHHAQGVTATASAENLLHAARNILAQASDLERLAKSEGTKIAGELRLGSFSTLAPMILPKLIQALSEDYPAVRPIIQEGSPEVLLDRLRDGQLDAALLYDIDLTKDLRLVKLHQPTPYVALPFDHPLAEQSSVSLEQLCAEPLILLDVRSSRNYFLGLFEAAGVTPNVAHSSPSLELVRGLVGQGLGYSILVTRPKGDISYDGHKLAIRQLSNATSNRSIVLATLAKLRPTRLITTFENLAVDLFQD